MTAKELRELTESELELKLKDLKEELFNLRFQHSVNHIARVSTVMRELRDEA